MKVVKPETVATVEMAGVELRAHQVEAVDAIVRGLTPRPGGEGPACVRGQVVMACGTGKSFVGAVSAQRLAPRGRVIVVVPTLELVAQMIGSWREAGRGGTMIAVCSLDEADLPLGVRATTNPVRLAWWLSEAGEQEPVTVFCTYTSAGVIADAHDLEVGYIQPPGRWDLMVCDEAHRSSGEAQKAWGIVHLDHRIPAAGRLYMTATPRAYEPPAFRGRPDAFQPLKGELVFSMDDFDLYGPVLYRLSLATAVDMELLAPFQILVLELLDPTSHPDQAGRVPIPMGVGAGDGSGEEGVRPARVAAVQAALLKAAEENNLSKVITFHNRTLEARYFAETLSQTAERLHREKPEHYPASVWSDWLCGEHEAEYRKSLIAEFGAELDSDGKPMGRAIMANCRVLGEGIDIPAVDAVALIDPRGSMVDIVQAVGRALRKKPGEGKLASLIVPIFLGQGEEPGDLLTSRSYGPLIRVLAALRAHDSDLVEQLAVPQKSGKRTKGRSVAHREGLGAGGAGEGEEGAFTLPVKFTEPIGADALALFVQVRVLSPQSLLWRRGLEAARAWFEEHDDLVVPVTWVTEDKFPLGQWIADQRREFAAGRMVGFRVDQLDEMGMVWSMHELAFETGLEYAAAWAAEHGGSLAAPLAAAQGGYLVGRWLSTQRSAAGLERGQAGALMDSRRAALEAIDPHWCPAWPIPWQRLYTAARLYAEESSGTVNWVEEMADHVTFQGEALGRWVLAQRAGWAELTDGQRELLDAIGIGPDEAAVAARAAKAPKRSNAQRFADGLAAARAFVEREGHLRVPRPHKEPLGEALVSLGTWVHNARARRAKLTEEQVAELDQLGMVWGG